MPGAELVVQLDEPALPAVLAGAVPTASGWSKHRSVDGPGAVELLSRVIEAAAPATTLVHCCAARPPIEVFRKAGADGVAVDLALLTDPAWEQIAVAVEAGTTLYAGVVPTTGPVPHPEQAAEPLIRRWRELGLDPELLAGRHHPRLRPGRLPVSRRRPEPASTSSARSRDVVAEAADST